VSDKRKPSAWRAMSGKSKISFLQRRLAAQLRGNHILQRHFAPLCKRLGLPRIRLHDVRHTLATLLFANRIPAKVVQEMLGHSDVGMTLDVYSHVLPEMQAEAAESLDNLLGDKSQDQV
jgi:integrase